MKRHFVPGYIDRDGIARASTCCTGECNQGRCCPLVPNRLPICRPAEPLVQRPAWGAQLTPDQVIPIRPGVTRVRVSRWRRARRFLAALRDHLLGERWGR